MGRKPSKYTTQKRRHQRSIETLGTKVQKAREALAAAERTATGPDDPQVQRAREDLKTAGEEFMKVVNNPPWRDD